MGEADRYIDKKIRRISLGDDTNALMALVAINGMLFICFGMIEIMYRMSDSTVTAFQYEVLRWAILPGKLSTLAYQPWTVFTYMFIHTGVLITIVNLLWLWAFGNILQNTSGNKVIIPIYIYGGLAGAAFFIGGAYAIPALRNQVEYLTLAGANASILAIAAAVTTSVPKYRLFPMLNGGIPLWVLTAVYVFISIATHAADLAYVIAVLGGGLMGYFFMYNYERGRDLGLWMNELYSWFIHLFEPDKKKKPARSTRNTLFYKTEDRDPFIKQTSVTQERIDSILDKINREGFDHLTEEEKSILRQAAKEDF